MNGFWYIEGADGKHYCWVKEPTYTCPIGSATRLGDIFETGCREADIDPEWLLRKLQHNGHRKRVSGRLADRCASCGHKLERLGFRCWVLDPSNSVAGFTMGASEKSFYVDTKREAQQWARDEVALTHKIKEEEEGHAH